MKLPCMPSLTFNISRFIDKTLVERTSLTDKIFSEFSLMAKKHFDVEMLIFEITLMKLSCFQGTLPFSNHVLG